MSMSLVERLEELGRILIAMAGSPIPTHLFQTLAEQARAAVACDYLAICLREADEDNWVVHPLVDVTGEGSLSSIGDGPVGSAVRAGHTVAIEDLRAQPAAGLERSLIARRLGVALTAPVRRGPEMLGALLFARARDAYTTEDVQIASLLAAGVGAALETSRAYQALADERITLAALVQSTQDAMIMINSEGIVLLANPAVRTMLSIDPDAIIGRPLADVLDRGSTRDLLEAGEARTVEFALGDGRTVQASLVPVSTPYGETVGVAAVLRDITLVHALVKMKNEFVSTVSHDLKNPVLTIAGTARLMRNADAADPRHRRWCDRIVRTADHMAELVGDLLDLGKVESGLEVPGEERDMVSLVREVIGLIDFEAETRQIKILAELPDQALVTVLPGRIKQVLLNLVGNAVKYTPAGGRVWITLATGGPHVVDDRRPQAIVVTVRDTGAGIQAADLPYVFHKFYRARGSATDAESGSGLGLAIAKSIVELHGGRIWVESDEGRGSTFGFSLPARPEPD